MLAFERQLHKLGQRSGRFSVHLRQPVLVTVARLLTSSFCLLEGAYRLMTKHYAARRVEWGKQRGPPKSSLAPPQENDELLSWQGRAAN